MFVRYTVKQRTQSANTLQKPFNHIANDCADPPTLTNHAADVQREAAGQGSPLSSHIF
jgi:hypothetical protein